MAKLDFQSVPEADASVEKRVSMKDSRRELLLGYSL